MIEPIDKEIDGKVYVLTKFPAVAGREIITQYPLSATPKIGSYEVNKTLMLKLMSHVGVRISGAPVPLMLSTETLVDNHVKSWETLGKLEIAMMAYNCSFFQDGRVLNFFQDFAQKLPMWISKILTDSLAQLLQATKQSSTN